VQPYNCAALKYIHSTRRKNQTKIIKNAENSCHGLENQTFMINFGAVRLREKSLISATTSQRLIETSLSQIGETEKKSLNLTTANP
jgi:hypothetical protein